MSGRGLTLAVMVLAACGLVGWWWRESDAQVQGVVLAARSAGDPSVAVQRQRVEEPPPMPASAAAQPLPESRFQLFRVVPAPAPGRAGETEALISVDGLPPRAYRVGDVVVGAVVLQSVQPNGATLGPAGGPAAVVLAVVGPSVPPSAGSSESQSTVDASDRPVVRPASAPAVDRNPVPVTDPDHGVDTSNH